MPNRGQVGATHVADGVVAEPEVAQGPGQAARDAGQATPCAVQEIQHLGISQDVVNVVDRISPQG